MNKMIIALLILSSIFIVACSIKEKTTPTQISNPAAVYCRDIGGNLTIITASDGSQSGTCSLNGKTCDEWMLFRGMCDDIHVCTKPQQENIACTMEYLPVCGDDGKTYGNACSACSAKIKAYTKEECAGDSTSQCGECPQLVSPSPDFCKNGTIVSGGTDKCNCTLPPKCVV